MAQISSANSSGNTNENSRRISASKSWCFTLNNYSQSDKDCILAQMITSKLEYIMGFEIGKENNTPHIQGYIYSKKKIRPFETFKNKKIHWEKCKGSKIDNFRYCAKDNNYLTNIKDVYLPWLTRDKMYPWQLAILDIIETQPNDRFIYWFYDIKGCSGKTTLGKYLGYYHDAIPLRGKTNDILHCAAEYPSNIYIFIAARCKEDYFPYEGLELIKDGFYMSGKYESKPIIRPSPHIFVLCNFAPEKHQLTEDRWKIIEINSPNI